MEILADHEIDSSSGHLDQLRRGGDNQIILFHFHFVPFVNHIFGVWQMSKQLEKDGEDHHRVNWAKFTGGVVGWNWPIAPGVH
jgi:hypothetical protein